MRPNLADMLRFTEWELILRVLKVNTPLTSRVSRLKTSDHHVEDCRFAALSAETGYATAARLATTTKREAARRIPFEFMSNGFDASLGRAIMHAAHKNLLLCEVVRVSHNLS